MPEKVAVILVPGIFASDLTHETLPAWPVNKIFGSGNDALFKQIYSSSNKQRLAFKQGAAQFQPNDLRKVASAADATDRGWGGVSDDTYLPFLRDCSAASGQLPFDPVVFAIGYNFVLSNLETATYIHDRTSGILERLRGEADFEGRFIYVTHSMGALPVRLALKQAGATRQRNCICVIHVAAPNAGAVEPLLRFVRGVLEPGTGNPKARAVEILFGDTGWKCITSASAIPAGFELLPIQMLRDRAAFPDPIFTSSPPFPDDQFSLQHVVGTFLSNAGYSVQFELHNGNRLTFSNPSRAHPVDKNHWETAVRDHEEIRSDFETHLAAATRFHTTTLDGYFFPRSGALALNGKNTAVGLNLTFDGGVLIRATEVIGTGGDGTVPLASQKYGIPSSFPARIASAQPNPTSRTITFSPLREISGVSHADALGSVAASQAFPKIYDLMSQFYNAYPRVAQ